MESLTKKISRALFGEVSSARELGGGDVGGKEGTIPEPTKVRCDCDQCKQLSPATSEQLCEPYLMSA